MPTKRPWIPVNIADFLHDTAHLSATECRAYLLLVFHYWIKGGLPEDETAIQRISRLPKAQWEKSKHILKAMFGPDWRHSRLDQEIAQVIERSKVNSANAAKSHSKRSLPAAPSPPTLNTRDRESKQANLVGLPGDTPSDDDEWRKRVSMWLKNNSVWSSRYYGPEPGMSGCRCPARILNEFGFDAATGRTSRH